MGDTTDDLVAQYLDLEGFEVLDDLLDACGATLDARALPILRRRLREEQSVASVLQARGYTRMVEKAGQIIARLEPLIAALEGGRHDA